MKSGNKYRIKHNNKDYGEFSKLSDALYERDCLFYCKFDYDLLVECDLPNKYENMELPPFPESRPRGQIKGNIKFNKKEREGEIVFDHKERKFCVLRGEEHFGKYDTAFRYRGCTVQGQIGNAPTQLCHARGLLDTVKLIFERSGGIDPLASEKPIPPKWYC